MRENNEILIELLTKMKIEAVFNKHDPYIRIKKSDLCSFLIKLLKLENSIK